MSRENRAANYLFLIFCGISSCLLVFRMTAKVRFIRGGLGYLLNPAPFYGSRVVERFASMPADVAQLISGDIQLRQARRRLKETAYVRSEVGALRRENERLRAAIGLKPAAGRSIRWARVMNRDPLEWHRSLFVDVGMVDDIPVNAPVLGLRGTTLSVVGRVTEVGRRSSKVLLLTDELSAVAADLSDGGWEGLIQGQGTARLRMNYLPVAAEFQLGESVHTSPTSAAFPAGLLIGTISKVFERDPFLAFKAVEVSPSVPAATLKEVMILVPKKSEEP